MPSVSPKLRSLSCTVIKKIVKPDNHASLFLIIDKTDSEANETTAHLHSTIDTEEDYAEQVTYYPLNNVCSNTRQDIQEGQSIILFIDDNLAKQSASSKSSLRIKANTFVHCDKVVALQLPDQPPVLTYPHTLQQMPYLRLFKEAFLVAIPCFGLLISLFGLLFSVRAKRNQSHRSLRLSFEPSFYLLSTIICCYPLFLIYFSLNQYLALAIAVSYGFLCLLNYFASLRRNQQVSSYNNLLLAKICVDKH